MLDIIKERRSVRGFDKDKQIGEEDVKKIIESAMYAPLALNKVSWRLTVVRNKEFLKDISEAIIGKLRESDSEHIKMRLSMPDYNPFYHAPTVIFVTADKENGYTGSNAGAAIQNMLLCAKGLGIDSCWIGMANAFLKSEGGKPYMDKLNTPMGYEIFGAVALGYGNVETKMPNKHMDEIDEIVKYID